MFVCVSLTHTHTLKKKMLLFSVLCEETLTHNIPSKKNAINDIGEKKQRTAKDNENTLFFRV